MSRPGYGGKYWEGVPEEMFAKVKVSLDVSDPMKRNAFTCKGCRRKYPSTSVRYTFERYNFCSECVTDVTDPIMLKHETTLEIYTRDKNLPELYKNVLLKNVGKPTFPVILFPDGLRAEFKFSDKSNFYTCVNNDLIIKAIPDIAYVYQHNIGSKFDGSESGMEPIISSILQIISAREELIEVTPFLINRYDLKPFNITFKIID